MKAEVKGPISDVFTELPNCSMTVSAANTNVAATSGARRRAATPNAMTTVNARTARTVPADASRKDSSTCVSSRKAPARSRSARPGGKACTRAPNDVSARTGAL